MSCSNPLSVWYDGINHKTGKRIMRFRPNIDKGQLQDYPDDRVACGQCLGCRLDHAKFWQNRCLMEMQDHVQTWFLTLTYDDDHLQEVKRSYECFDWPDPDTGEVRSVPCASLDLDCVQKWKKRLAKAWSKRSDVPLRFFGCGEYGDSTHRPHYHFLVFGLDLDESELIFYKHSRIGNVTYPLYNCDWISDTWGKGHVVLAKGSYETAGYVARYVLKKRVGKDKSFYARYNIDPPFINMSRRPGIGLPYLDQVTSVIVTDDGIDDIVISTEKGHKVITVSGYMLDKLEKVYPDIVQKVKDNRRAFMVERKRQMMQRSDMPYWQQLARNGEMLESKTKSLMLRGAVDIEK